MHPFVPAPCSYRESLTTGLPRIKGLDMPSTIIRFEQTLILTMAGRLCDPSLSRAMALPRAFPLFQYHSPTDGVGAYSVMRSISGSS